MTFDEQVAALRGKVVPKRTGGKKKCDCTPEEWAANLDCSKAAAAMQRKAHPERHRAAVKAWRDRNLEKHRAGVTEWRVSNRDKHRAAVNAWRNANKDRVRSVERERYKNDPIWRMMKCLRVRQRQFFNGQGRSLSMVRDMGCTKEFFRQHITRQLTGNMTLENYGTVWHLDHIYPLARANIVNDPIHFLAAANWRNLQPLPGPDNWEKSDTVTPDAQALFDSLVREFTTKESAA